MKSLLSVGMLCAIFTHAEYASGSVQVVGGSSLLTQTYADQLGTWLGEGDITLTNIYTKQTGDDSLSFHAAVDFQGRTFAVMQVLRAKDPRDEGAIDTNQIVGGYNPQSWDSVSGDHLTPLDSQRTAFLFNLTSTEIQRQSLTTDPLDAGIYQTYNDSSAGPTFGGLGGSGFDIYVDTDLTSNGVATNYSYGGTVDTDNILSGISPYQNDIIYGRMEVFSIANGLQGAVPELASVAIWSILGLIAGVRYRRALYK